MTQPTPEQIREYIDQVAAALVGREPVKDEVLIAAAGHAARRAVKERRRDLLASIVVNDAMGRLDSSREAAQPDPLEGLGGGLPPLGPNATPTATIPVVSAAAPAVAPARPARRGKR
jgi:hypothetical protein